jgi:hypothetical protein
MINLAQNLTEQKNIIIAAIISIVLIFSSAAVIAFYYESSIANKFSFLDLNLPFNQTNVVQGSALRAKVSVISIGNAENVTLGSDVGSSGINCSFDPAMGRSNFTSTLTISVPDSTPTGNYSVIVTALGGGAKENASCILSVLSAKVTVSGIVSVQYPAQINFTDLQTNLTSTFQFPLTESTLPSVNGRLGDAVLYSSGNSYSFTLLNEHTTM